MKSPIFEQQQPGVEGEAEVSKRKRFTEKTSRNQGLPVFYCSVANSARFIQTWRSGRPSNKDRRVLPVDMTQLTGIQNPDIHQKLLTQTWDNSSALVMWQGTDEVAKSNLEDPRLKYVWKKVLIANSFLRKAFSQWGCAPTFACSRGNARGHEKLGVPRVRLFLKGSAINLSTTTFSCAQSAAYKNTFCQYFFPYVCACMQLTQLHKVETEW